MEQRFIKDRKDIDLFIGGLRSEVVSTYKFVGVPLAQVCRCLQIV